MENPICGGKFIVSMIFFRKDFKLKQTHSNTQAKTTGFSWPGGLLGNAIPAVSPRVMQLLSRVRLGFTRARGIPANKTVLVYLPLEVSQKIFFISQQPPTIRE
jgi:hypothetical protein